MAVLTEAPGQKQHPEPREVKCLGHSHTAKDRGRICTWVFKLKGFVLSIVQIPSDLPYRVKS